MESTGQSLYHARRLPSYRDIDSTLDEFVTYFKLKYLPNIQFTTASSRRLFVKNALDFHRSKGSTRSVELFFRLIYGVSANIYYPGDDLLRISDGDWVIPIYVEVTPSPINKTFIGKQVTGVNSFATAFVETYTRVRVKSKYIDIFYLSDISGTFLAGEFLRTETLEPKAPKVIGSTTAFAVTAGGAGFSLGERLGTISENGQFATGIVSKIATVVGAANINLVDGGYGYNSGSEILISDKTLTISGLSNSTFSKLGNLQEYYANGDLASNSTIIGWSPNHVIEGQLISGDFAIGQHLTQGSLDAAITKVEKVGSTVSLSVQNVVDFFVSTQAASTNTGSINVTSYSTLVGIANVSGPGAFTSGNDVFEVGSGLTGTIQTSAQTSNDLSFAFASNTRFTNMSTSNVGLDYVKPYANTPLNALEFDFPKDPTGNVSSDEMITMLYYETRNYGTIANTSLINLYSGSGYAQEPFILILEEIPYARRRARYELLVGSQTSAFIIGEKIITGTFANNAVFDSSDPITGIVVSADVDERVIVKRLSVDRRFYEHDPDHYMIIGETSGATARLLKVNTPAYPPEYIGLNANINADVFTSNGLVTNISLATSGYGYVDKETVTFFSLDDPDKTGRCTLQVKTHGIGAGYYMTEGGSLSSNKFIQDNDYYQDYSYEIQTSVQSDTYKQMLDQVLHVAGTKGFYSYLSVKNVTQKTSIAESELSVEE